MGISSALFVALLALDGASALVMSPVGFRGSAMAPALASQARVAVRPVLQAAEEAAPAEVAAAADEADVPAEYSPVQDSLAGVAVAFSLLSKAIACSAIVGVNPLVGLWSSVVMGLTAPLMGGRPGVISGAAAVVVVPLGALTAAHGTAYVAPVIFLSATIQLLFGVFKLARLSKLVSGTVMNGFLNGLGYLLGLSQLKIFKGANAIPSAAIAALCFCVVQYGPKFTKGTPLEKVPSSLAGLGIASAVGAAFSLPLKTLEQSAAAGTFAGGFSSFPTFIDFGGLASMLTSVEVMKIAVPAAIGISFISLLECLLAGKLVDEMKGEDMCTFEGEDVCELPFEEKNPNPNPNRPKVDVPTKSVLAMSTGNFISSLLGGFGGCGLIPQTVLNLKSGGGGVLSSVVYALSMAMFVIFAAPLVGKISLAALAGLMFTIAYDTIQWGGTKDTIMEVVKPTAGRASAVIQLGVLCVATYLCAFVDMAVGITLGVVMERGLQALLKKYQAKTA